VSIASDSLALAAATGVAVILVLRAGKTQRQAALEVKELFGRFDVDVKGVILNLIPPRDLSPYYTTVKRYYGDTRSSSRHNGRRIPATTVEGICRYIDSRKVAGMGPKTTESIVNHFGLETLDVLEHHPERLNEVDGIGPQRARLIARAWSEQQRTQDSKDGR
jgi:ATP-dependent exoDNAse (exonuclease V) alpha subunit